MEQKNLYISIAVVVVLVFVLGLALGIFYQTQKATPQIQQTAEVIDGISSEVINAVVAYGSVSGVGDDRKVTLSYNGDNLDIALQDSAKIYLYEGANKKEIQFQDIEIGDKANITAEISKEGKIQGNMMIIFPRP
jgi:hypothetical protein